MLKQLLSEDQFEITNDWRERLEIAKDNLKKYFLVVGDIKKFDESLMLIKKALGWKIQPVYLRINVTQKRPKVDEIDPLVRDKIIENNRWDMELFDYVKSASEAELSRQSPDFFRQVDEFKTLNSLFQTGVEDYKNGDYDSARLKLLSACEIEPNSPEINNYLGLVYEGLEDTLSALKCFRQALLVNSSCGKTILNCANILSSMNMNEDADYFKSLLNEQSTDS